MGFIEYGGIPIRGLPLGGWPLYGIPGGQIVTPSPAEPEEEDIHGTAVGAYEVDRYRVRKRKESLKRQIEREDEELIEFVGILMGFLN